MKQKIMFLLLGLMMLCPGIGAATLPTVSTPDNTVWYLIQFMNGKNVLTAQGDGQKVLTGVPTGKSSQLWKIEGSSSEGYTLTSKTGLTLYTSTTAKEGMFYASSAPTKNTLFKFLTTTNSTYSGNFVIAPKGNTSVFMNQWGGAGTGAELGLWNDRADANQPLQFVEEKDFAETGQPLPLIPYPFSLKQTEGTLALQGLTAITYADDNSKSLAENFAKQLKDVTSKALSVEQETGNARKNAISLVSDATKGPEAYALTVNADGVVIAASSYAGYFYGLQTLRQLLPSSIFGTQAVTGTDNWTLPFVEIEDKPLFGHRGFHFDVARHFFSMDEIKKLLDVAAIYKLNRFHWHLTDDQGWRVEIPEYPKLTTVGAVRNGSLTVTASPNFYDDTEYGRGCFYTLDELREIVAYAKERNIEIIPEIDLPGHMVAAITAYPELSCDPSKTYEVRIDGGISHDVLNVGDDKVIDFLKCVLGHVANVFPYKYIHLGGDECPTGAWQSNADCLRRIQEEGLKDVHDLQPWLVETLGCWLRDVHGKDVVVWDELLARWKSEYTVKPVIMAWNGVGYAATAAEKGLSSISVPYYPLYFDFMQVPESQELIDEPYIGGWGINPLPNVYNFNPLGNMSGKESYLLGTQANLWTESCTTNEEAEYQFYPRLLALSEIAWLPAAKKNWMSFYMRLQQGVKVLDEKGIYYAKHYIEQPELTETETAIAEAETLLKASRPGEVGYPSQADYDKLRAALGETATAETLQKAIADYKVAKLTMPAAGKRYRIISASTATRSRYDGSSVYVKGTQLNMHYTPQAEPEELWQFIPQADGSFIITHATSGKAISMPQYNEALQLSATGTPVVLEIPKANASYSYIPGVMTISAAADKSGTNTRRFFGNNSGILTATDNAQLCMGGTWRIVEVTDYKAFLQSLCEKCERIIATSKPGEYDEPTQEALDFLAQSLIAPAKQALDGEVTEAVYMQYAALYQQFVDMPRASLLETISEKHYYKLRSTYFNTYFAFLNTSAKTVQPKTSGTSNAYLWAFRKNEDGTVTIFNKANWQPVYVTSSSADQPVRTGKEYSWTLKEITTDIGQKGIAIIEKSGANSWYTNPGSFANVILKPYDWGGSIWTFEKQDEEIPTGILSPEVEGQPTKYYDLSGRRVAHPENGIYITDQQTKVLK